MANVLLFLIVIALLIWWGYSYNRALPEHVPQQVRDNRLLQWFWRQKLSRQFQEWVMLSSLYERHPLYQGLTAAKQDAFANWLRDLEEAEFQRLFTATKQFCKDSHVNLHWILNGGTHADEALRTGVTASVVSYLVAYWEANALQARASAFQRYTAWQNNPTGRANRATTQTLYTQLSSTHHDVQPLPADLTLAPQAQRLHHMVAAIEQVAAYDMEAIYHAITALDQDNGRSALRMRIVHFAKRVRHQPQTDVAVPAATQRRTTSVGDSEEKRQNEQASVEPVPAAAAA